MLAHHDSKMFRTVLKQKLTMENSSTKSAKKQSEFLSICPEHYERIEHYSNRSTIWIKLYADLLRDFDFCKLPDETKWHFVGLMILSTQMFNRFPNDVDFLMQQIGANKKNKCRIAFAKRLFNLC